MRRRSRASTSTSAGGNDAPASTGASDASKEALEAKARILKQAQEQGTARTTLPRRTTLAQVKAEEEQKKTDNKDDARAKELEELNRIEADEQKVQADLRLKFGKQVILRTISDGAGKIEIPFDSADDLDVILRSLDL